MSKLLICIFLPAASILSLDGDWHVHTTMADVRDIEYYGGKVYGATGGGLIAIDVEDASIDRYSISDGLGGTGISCIAIDRDIGKIYLGMDNGNLSVLYKGKFRVYTDFKSQKRIRFNRLYVYKGTLLIATNEGISFFSGDENDIVGPSFNNFGDETNPYRHRTQEVRDIRVWKDTLYILTRFFWARMDLNWEKPLLESNPKLQFATPKLWETNGAQGHFAYQIQLPDGDIDTIGFSQFIIVGGAVSGLVERDVYEGIDNSTYSLNEHDYSYWVHSYSLSGNTLKDFGKRIELRVRYNCMAFDDKGRLYIGTQGRGVLRQDDTLSYWNGDEQTFTLIHALDVDHYGNVYATNTHSPGDNYANKRTSMGILKFDGTRWYHILSEYLPGITLGMNSFVVDTYGRLFATFAEDSLWNHGFIIFDNPFLKTSGTVKGRAVGPYVYQKPDTLGPLYCVTQGLIFSDPEKYMEVSTFIPTAMCYDKKGNFYFTQSENEKFGDSWRNPGGIRVFRDYSVVSTLEWGDYTVNLTNYSGRGPKSGFKQLGKVKVPAQSDNYQHDGHYNSIGVDIAGNIWAVGQSKSKVNVFGLKQHLNHPDTLIFDNNDQITNYLYRTGAKGIAECKRGLEAHLSSKTLKKVKADIHGDIWIGTTAGLFYYADGRDTLIPNNYDTLEYSNCNGLWRYFLPDISINDFDFDSLNNIWIATDDKGLKMLHSTTAKYFTDERDYGTGDRSEIKFDSYNTSSGLISNRVLSVAVFRKKGKVYVGFENGLQEFESGIREARDIKTGYVYPILVKGYDRLLLNTMENGSSIRVYSLSGQLIFYKKLSSYHSSYNWDTRNKKGTYIATGVYLYRFVSPTNSAKVGKFAVVR